MWLTHVWEKLDFAGLLIREQDDLRLDLSYVGLRYYLREYSYFYWNLQRHC